MRMFIKCLAPTLIGDYSKNGVKEALRSELTDNCTRILNEGAAHGLAAAFSQAVQKLDFATLSLGAQRNRDANYVNGFLLWLAITNRRRNYYTRSAMVARVASCLRVVGGDIGRI